MTADEIILIEYSQNQKCFHIQSLKESCITNLTELVKNKFQCEYIPIGYASSVEEAHKLIDKIQAEFDLPTSCG
jgi:hypothetical protein